MNMEQVITDQNYTIEKLKSDLKQNKRNEIIDKNMEMMRLNIGSGFNNETQSEIDMSMNISRQFNLQNFKDEIEETGLVEGIDDDTIIDVLNVSYQVLNSGSKGIQKPPLLSRSRNNKNSGSTTAEDDSQYKSKGNRIFKSIGNFG